MDVANLEIRADSSSVRTATASITGMGAASSGAMSKVKLLSGALVAMGAGTALAKVIRDTNQFTKSISELSAITGATGDDLAFYEEQAAKIGKTTTLSASQAATAFKLIASAKPDLLASKEALAAVTKEAVTLAEAAGVDLAAAAQTVGVSLNQFGAEADQASRFVNVLAAGAKMGSSSITDTSAAMKNAGVAAKLAGLSFEEANVGVQLLAKGGLFAAEAGTGFRQVLLKLENEAENKFKPSIMGLAGALENLAKENMSLTELTSLFGAEAMKSAAVMIDGAKDARTLEAAITGTSIASEMAATNFDNMEGDMLSLNSANEGLAITFGKMLEPAIRKSLKAATDLSRAFDEFVQSDKFIRYITILTNGLKAISLVIGVQLISALGASIVSFASAATAATLFGRAVTLMGGPIGVGVLALWGLYEILNKVVGTNTSNLQRELQLAINKGVEPLTEHIKTLKTEQDRLIESTEKWTGANAINSGALNHHQGQVIALKNITNTLAEAEAVLEEKLSLVTTATNISTEATDQLTQGFADLEVGVYDNNIAMAESVELVETQISKYDELTSSLGLEMTQVTMNTREQFLYNQQLKLGAEATLAERLAIEDLAGSVFDAKENQKAYTEANKESDEAVQALTVSQQIQQNMVENLQKSFSDLIYKTLDDGKINFKSFFDTVVAGFKNLVAELISQKIMEAIFGQGGLDGFIKTLTNGFGGIINSLASGLGNIINSMVATVTGKVASTAITTAATSAVSTAATTAAVASGGSAAAQAAIAAGTGSMAANAAAANAAAAGGTAAGGTAAAGGTGIIATAGAKIAAGAKAVGTALATGANAVGTAISTGAAKLATLVNPVTAAIAAALLIAKNLDKSGTMSSNAGMVTDSSINLKGRGFDIPAFASGAQFTGFTRRGTQDQAKEVINSFGSLDTALTLAAQSVGLTPDLNAKSFVGAEETGRNFGSGAFLGTASEAGKGKSLSMNEQLDSYATQWVKLAGSQAGVSTADINAIIGDGTAAGILGRAEAVSQKAIAAAASVVVEPIAAIAAVSNGIDSITLGANVSSLAGSLGPKMAGPLSAITMSPNASGTASSLGPNFPSISSFGTVANIRSTEEIAQIAQGIERGAFNVGDVATQFNLTPAEVQATFDQMKADGSFASGINRIPFDGFKAELHEGERVQSVAEVKRSEFMATEMANMRGNLNELMLVVAKAVTKTARIEARWDINGLPPTRT